MAPYTASPRSRVRRLCALIGLALAACADTGSDYYPLDDGRWWYFQTTTTILDEHRDQRFIVSNFGSGTYAGKPVFVQRQSSGRDIYLSRGPRGIERVGVRQNSSGQDPAAAPALILPAELSTESRWTVQTHLALIESRTFARQDKLLNLDLPVQLSMSVAATDETVEVPAGRFNDCVRIEGTGMRSVRVDRGNASAEVHVTHREWYAPGVGLIKSARMETSDSPFLKAGEYSQLLLQFEP